MLLLFLKAVLLGFIASLGLGAVTILVINRTFRSGKNNGFVTGLGAALSDTIYAGIAFLGVSLIIGFIDDYQGYIRLFMMIVLLGLAIQIWFKTPDAKIAENRVGARKLLGSFSSCFLLALSNPIMVIVYLSVFALFPKIASSASAWDEGGLVIAGIFSGAVLWWFALTFFLARVSRFFSGRFIGILNKISALIVFGLAVYSGISGVIQLFSTS